MRMLSLATYVIYEVCNSPSAHVLLDNTICFFKHSIVIRFTKHDIRLQQVLIEGVKTCTKTTKPPYPAPWLHIDHITFMRETDDEMIIHIILKHFIFYCMLTQCKGRLLRNMVSEPSGRTFNILLPLNITWNEQQLPVISKIYLLINFFKSVSKCMHDIILVHSLAFLTLHLVISCVQTDIRNHNCNRRSTR